MKRQKIAPRSVSVAQIQHLAPGAWPGWPTETVSFAQVPFLASGAQPVWPTQIVSVARASPPAKVAQRCDRQSVLPLTRSNLLHQSPRQSDWQRVFQPLPPPHTFSDDRQWIWLPGTCHDQRAHHFQNVILLPLNNCSQGCPPIQEVCAGYRSSTAAQRLLWPVFYPSFFLYEYSICGPRDPHYRPRLPGSSRLASLQT